MDKFKMQDEQYTFPYHWIPQYADLYGKRQVMVTRQLWWGFEYLCYSQYILDHLRGGVHILDVGCGDGRLAGLYFEQGGQGTWKGIDLSEKAITLARILNGPYTDKADFAVEDVTAVSGDEGRYDCATLIEVLEHIPDENISGFLQGISRKLEPGGKLFITVPSVNIPLEKKHYRHYTPELLRRQVEQAHCGLEMEECRYILPQKRRWEFYKRLTMNKYWQIHLNILDSAFFSAMKKNVERAGDTGRTVFAVIKKIGEI